MDSKPGQRSAKQQAIQDRLIEELHTLYYSGKTRVEAKKLFVGKRGKTWVDKNWPDAERKAVCTLRERDAHLLELHELYRTGSTMHEAMAAMEGRQSKTWVRVHWPESNVVPQGSIYANQNIKPKVRQESSDEWKSAAGQHCDVNDIMRR